VYPETASLPSGDISALRTQDEWPPKDATAPEAVLLGEETRTSNKVNVLSSDDDRRSYTSINQFLDVRMTT
jgi:hypothetical protein